LTGSMRNVCFLSIPGSNGFLKRAATATSLGAGRGPMADRPSRTAFTNAAVPIPSGETTPVPVMATVISAPSRLFLCLRDQSDEVPQALGANRLIDIQGEIEVTLEFRDDRDAVERIEPERGEPQFEIHLVVGHAEAPLFHVSGDDGSDLVGQR